MLKYSVIIISFNEEKNIVPCIKSIKNSRADVDIILSDGGSSDGTIKLALTQNIKIIYSPQGRGTQFNFGSREANGEILLFLHADTLLPENAFNILDQYFQSDKTQIGTFRLSFDYQSKILKFYSFLSIVDSILTRFGDQCIVVRRSFYKQLGGFNNFPLFEDVDFLRRARGKTKIYSFPANVITSSSSFRQHGLIIQQVRNGLYLILYLLGVSPATLAKKYYSKRIVHKKKF
ncbi:MAG TPA: glycosyltransferase [Ignavibacteria bacterium]|nr:glycosyltransferase [Ignavibacteria bacterium]